MSCQLICHLLLCSSQQKAIILQQTAAAVENKSDSITFKPGLTLVHVFEYQAIEGVIAVDRALEVRFGNGKSIKFEDCWLRDHCRCSYCYHSDTFQRAHHILDIPDVTVLTFTNDTNKIEVTWSDNHKSTYKAEFLSKFDYKTWKESRKLKPILWHGPIDNKIPKVPVEEFLSSVEGAQRVFQSLLDYGVALVDGVMKHFK